MDTAKIQFFWNARVSTIDINKYYFYKWQFLNKKKKNNSGSLIRGLIFVVDNTLLTLFIYDERSPFFALRPSWVSFFFSFPLLPFENKDDNFIFINYFVLFFDCCTFHDVLIIF